MRTTVTLEPDVERLLREAMHREGVSFKAALNDAVRRGLAARPARRRRVEVPVHHGGPAPGVDPDRLNQLVDELEDEAILAGWNRR